MVGDATALPFADDAFGAAIACHVLHLVADWVAVVAELRRVLRPGGVLLVTRGAARSGLMAEATRRIRAEVGAPPRRVGLDQLDDLDADVTAAGGTVEHLPPLERTAGTTGRRRPHRGGVPGRPRRERLLVDLGPARRRLAAAVAQVRQWVADEHGDPAGMRLPFPAIRWHRYVLPPSVGVTAAPGGRQGGRAGGRHSPRGDGSGAAACAWRDRSACRRDRARHRPGHAGDLDVVPAPQTSADGPTTDPTHVVPSAAPILVDGEGRLVALDPALDDRMICTHDLGPVWRYDDAGPPGRYGPGAGHLQPFGDGVPRPMPRYLDDGRRRVRVAEGVQQPGSGTFGVRPADGRAGLENGQGPQADAVTGPVTPAGCPGCRGVRYRRQVVQRPDAAARRRRGDPGRGHAVGGVPHDPDVLQLVALTAVARYRHEGLNARSARRARAGSARAGPSLGRPRRRGGVAACSRPTRSASCSRSA